MGKTNSIALGKTSGSLGNVTFRLGKNGEVITSQKISKGTQKVGTYDQVSRRVILANMVTAYQRLNATGDGKGMHHSFPLRPRGNDFNGFVAENMQKATVAAVMVPKNLGNVLVPAPFIVSRGNLRAPVELQATFNAGTFVMSGTNNFANMGELSTALINNYYFSDGDTVTFFGMTFGGAMQSAIITGRQIVLDTQSTDPLPSWISAAGVITVTSSTNSDAVIVRGRRGESGWNVSDAEFSDACMASDAYAAYTGSAAEQLAVDSWGYKSEPYLQANPQ